MISFNNKITLHIGMSLKLRCKYFSMPQSREMPVNQAAREEKWGSAVLEYVLNKKHIGFLFRDFCIPNHPK